MSISIVMMVAGIHLLFERRYVWLLPLAFVFALTYDMVLLLWVAALFWLVVTVWQERALNREVAWAFAACVIVVAGTALGFVINPYFPHNVALLIEHFIIKVTPKNFSTSVGSEWYPYDTWEFLANCGVALVAMFAGYLAFRDSASKGSKRAFFLLFFSTFLMIVNMRWRRFAEYFPPFAVLFAAFALEPLIRRARQTAVEPVAVADASEAVADASE
jgi:asparagine N-glycosylation enzyme membrane subunit Stt3